MKLGEVLGTGLADGKGRPVPTVLSRILDGLPDGLSPGISASAHGPLLAVLVGVGAGLLSIAHCAAMCGPLSAYACGIGGDDAAGRPRSRAALWVVGRTLAYAVLGAFAGATSGAIARLVTTGPLQILVSGTLALALLVSGLSLLGVRSPLTRLGKGPTKSWTSRFMGRALSLPRSSPAAPLLLGSLSGLLPCGALWAALASASALGSAPLGALAMVGFSLASAPGLFLSGLLGDLRTDGRARRLLGAAFLLGASVLLIRPLLASETGAPACHDTAPRLGSLPAGPAALQTALRCVHEWR